MDEKIRIEFAKHLRVLREKKGWTQEKLADQAELSYRHIQRLESLKNPPPAKIDTLEKLAVAMKVSRCALVDF